MKESVLGGLTPSGDRYTGLDGRLYQFDGMRGLGFIAIFINHAFSVSLLWVSLDMFFVLSGFLITTILLNQRTRDGYFRIFYYRRFLRIFPPYYLFLLIVFVFFENWEANWYWYTFYVSNIREAFFCNDSVGVLIPIWSLAVEEQFYLLWPVLVYVLGPKGVGWFSLALILSAPLVRSIWAGDPCVPVYFLLPCRIDSLAAGALLAVARQEIPTSFQVFSRYGLRLAIGCAAIFAILMFTIPTFRLSANSVLFGIFGFSFPAVAMAGLVAYMIPDRQGWLHKLTCNRVIVYVGTISYSMYLYHGLLIHLFRQAGFPRLSGALLAFAVGLIWCSISWFFFEKPLQAYKNRGWGRTPDARKTIRSLALSK